MWWLLLKSLTPALLAAVLGVFGYLYWAGQRPLTPGPDLYVISPGSGISQLAHQLLQRRVIREPYSLMAWAYAKRYTRQIKAGEYRFEPGITLERLLEQTVQGKVVRYSITFIEGWTFRQIKMSLQSAQKLMHTVSGDRDVQIMSKLGRPDQHPEGRFYPDTYVYTAGVPDIDILRQAYRRMDAQLKKAWLQRPENSLLNSVDEVLTLASIIEKETGKPEERALIAAVFHNRLRRRMRLQTDPTVIYGLGEQFDGNLTRRHLQLDTPYNTYTRRGLPPTPIAMPSAESIHAALHPARSSALYFVARGDGSHQFSDTLKAHNRAVAKYQLAGKPRPSSSRAMTKQQAP